MVPAWKTWVSLEIESNPAISSFVGYESGYPLDAKTTHTANWSFQEGKGKEVFLPKVVGENIEFRKIKDF